MTKKLCLVPDCDRPSRSKGMCTLHAARVRNHGSTELPTRTEIFWSKVDVRSAEECWEWQGVRMPRGYGVFTFDHKRVLTHRLSYFLAHGEWPEPMCCHHCDNPPCVNPGHLYAGDGATNLRDARSRGRMFYDDAFSANVRAGIGRARIAGRLPDKNGIKNPNVKLTDEEVADVRRLYSEGRSQSSIGKQYGVAQGHVSRLVRGVQRPAKE